MDAEMLPNLSKVKVEENEDPIVAEYPVILSQAPENKYLFKVCFPTNKLQTFRDNTELRFKRNVKLLEMRLKMDMHTGSFDRHKVEHSATDPSRVKKENYFESIFVGQSNPADLPARSMIGVMKNGCFHLCQVDGIFEMRHKTKHEQETKIEETEDEDAESEEESDSGESDNPETSAAPVRVRFARAETDKQKKRREQSSQHRKKIAEQDPWIRLNCHQEEKSRPLNDFIGPTILSDAFLSSVCDVDKLEEKISGKERTNPDLECGDLITHKKVKHIEKKSIVRGLIMKLEAASFDQIEMYLLRFMKREEILEHLKENANLVSHLWIIKSDLLFTDETLKMARDLMLCLLNANLPVRRCDFQKAFGLREGELDRIFDVVFLERSGDGFVLKKYSNNDTDDISVVLEQKRYWTKRWEEIHSHLHGLKKKIVKRSLCDEQTKQSPIVPLKRRATRRVLMK